MFEIVDTAENLDRVERAGEKALELLEYDKREKIEENQVGDQNESDKKHRRPTWRQKY